jgi:hypothetical protein
MDLWKVVDYLILGPKFERPLLELAAQKQLKSEVANTVSGVLPLLLLPQGGELAMLAVGCVLMSFRLLARFSLFWSLRNFA